MQRLWVRWAALVVFVAVLGTVFVNLGEWQLRRLAEREGRNQVTIVNEQRPVQQASAVFTRPITDDDQWQRVELTGTYDAEHQFVVRYRQNGEDNGYEIVTPLRASFGTVLVDRGFVTMAPGTAIPSTAPAPPAGEVTVTGHVRRNENGRSSAVTPVGNQMRLISSDAIQTVLPYPVVNGYVGLLTSSPAQAPDLQVVRLPELSEGPHFWYAVQWFMFTGIGVLGIVVFIRGDLRERRLARDKAAAAAEREPART